MVINAQFQYMQFGCGYTSSPEGWINIDASPSLFLQRIPIFGRFSRRFIKPRFPDSVIFGDILHDLPIKKGSLKGIYCSHVLEHLSLEGFKAAIQNTYQYLAPNGIFRLVMPDFNYFVQQYIMSDNPSASIDFMLESLLGVTKRERSLSIFLRNYLGNSRHLWLWDFNSAKTELNNTGFKHIRKAKFGDSCDPRFFEIEDEMRWKNCLGIECQKFGH